MSEKDDGGSAFPHLIEGCQRVNETEMHGGMTLRDYFAAAFMKGAVSNASWDPPTAEVGARICYEWADAMLKEGAK